MSTRPTIACVLGALLLMSGPATLAAAADRSADASAPSPEQHGATTTVRAWLRVRAVPPRIGADGKLDLAEFEFYKRNLAAIVKSPLVVNKALEDKKVQELPCVKGHHDDLTNWLIDNLRVRYPGDAEIMTVEMRGVDRPQATTLVNAVIEALKANFVDDRERSDRLSRSDELEKKLNAYKQQVLDKERQLYNLSQQIGTTDSQTARVQYKMQVDALDTLMHSRTDVQKEIADVDLKIALAKLEAESAEKNDGENAREKAAEIKALKALAVRRQLLDVQYKQITEQITEQAENIQRIERFNGEADQVRAEVEQLRAIVRDMETTLIKSKIEWDAEPRVSIIELAH